MRLGQAETHLKVGFRLPSAGCCQSNANQSPLFAGQQVLGSDKVASLEKGGVSELFKSGSGLDIALMIEMIVH